MRQRFLLYRQGRPSIRPPAGSRAVHRANARAPDVLAARVVRVRGLPCSRHPPHSCGHRPTPCSRRLRRNAAARKRISGGNKPNSSSPGLGGLRHRGKHRCREPQVLRRSASDAEDGLHGSARTEPEARDRRSTPRITRWRSPSGRPAIRRAGGPSGGLGAASSAPRPRRSPASRRGSRAGGTRGFRAHPSGPGGGWCPSRVPG